MLVYTIRYTEPGKPGELTARNRYGIKVMERVAKDAGGEPIDAKAMDAKEYFQRIADELRTSYTLACYPIKDAVFRRVIVRPTRDGIKIRTKSGHFARTADERN